RIFVSDNKNENPRFLREFRPKTQIRHEDFDGDEDLPELDLDPKSREEEERVARSFSHELGHWLEEQARHKAFNSLILCAEEHFLKILENQLGGHCRKALIGKV